MTWRAAYNITWKRNFNWWRKTENLEILLPRKRGSIKEVEQNLSTLSWLPCSYHSRDSQSGISHHYGHSIGQHIKDQTQITLPTSHITCMLLIYTLYLSTFVLYICQHLFVRKFWHVIQVKEQNSYSASSSEWAGSAGSTITISLKFMGEPRTKSVSCNEDY